MDKVSFSFLDVNQANELHFAGKPSVLWYGRGLRSRKYLRESKSLTS